jgi:hypothetical protein
MKPGCACAHASELGTITARAAACAAWVTGMGDRQGCHHIVPQRTPKGAQHPGGPVADSKRVLYMSPAAFVRTNVFAHSDKLRMAVRAIVSLVHGASRLRAAACDPHGNHQRLSSKRNMAFKAPNIPDASQGDHELDGMLGAPIHRARAQADVLIM